MQHQIATNEHPATVRVVARSVYGATKFYPTNATAHGLAAIAKTTTLTIEVLRIAKSMGLDIVVDGDLTVADMINRAA